MIEKIETIDHLQLDHIDSQQDDTVEESQDGNDDLQTETDALESAPGEQSSKVSSTAVPPKRPQSAYFIFMQEKRSKIQQDNPDITSIGGIAKLVGQMWKDLSHEERKPYQDIANEQKKLWQKEMEEFKLQHPNYSTSTAGSSKHQTGVELILPIGRIKKLCRLDPEVKSLSKDAVLLATKCAELFTEALARETEGVARIQKRKKLICQDIVDVCSLKERYFFLKEDISDLLQMQKSEEKDIQHKKQKQMEATTEQHGSKKGTLDSFFQTKK